MLTPSSESVDDWGYLTVKVADLGADIGRPSIGDTDLDGWADIFVPLYDAKKAVSVRFVDPVASRFHRTSRCFR